MALLGTLIIRTDHNVIMLVCKRMECLVVQSTSPLWELGEVGVPDHPSYDSLLDFEEWV